MSNVSKSPAEKLVTYIKERFNVSVDPERVAHIFLMVTSTTVDKGESWQLFDVNGDILKHVTIVFINELELFVTRDVQVFSLDEVHVSR